MIDLPETSPLVEALAALPTVVAVTLGGSRATGRADEASDYDINVYHLPNEEPDPELRRRAYLDIGARIGDIALDLFGRNDDLQLASGQLVDVMFWSTTWIEHQVGRVLDEHVASLGYSTCWWANVLLEQPLRDPTGWFQRFQADCRRPYPETLRAEILRKNRAALWQSTFSFRSQLARAVERSDAVAVNHRIAAALASIFDIVFAATRRPHPGEKRLLEAAALPPPLETCIGALAAASAADAVASMDAAIAGLEAWLSTIDRSSNDQQVRPDSTRGHCSPA